ncbi:MAG: J domain-containing protein, partial [Planctomycetaceae bacterium]
AEKFKQVQQAYDVLSDDKKRSNYDLYGSAEGPVQTGPRRPTGGPSPFERGGFPFDLEGIFGTAGGPGRNPFARDSNYPSDGPDVDIEVEIPFQTAVEGGDYDLFLQRNGRDEPITVKIPPGIDTGKIIRLNGLGQPGVNGGRPGNLMVRVVVAKHPWFRREGRDLLVDVPVTVTEAALGAKVDVPTLSEGMVRVTIPPGTSSGAKLRLKGKGVLFQATKQRGDMYVVIRIVLPPALSEKAQESLRKFAEEAPFDPRGGLW